MSLFGFHTQADLDDLIAAYHTQYGDITATVNKIDASQNPPSAAWSDFKSRFDAWNASYQPVLANATAVAADGGAFAGTDQAYTDLAKAFSLVTDFDRELRQKFLASTDYSNTPQPTATDADLEILKAAQKATSHIVDPLVGDKSLAADKSKLPLPSGWKGYAVAAGIGAAALIILKRLI